MIASLMPKKEEETVLVNLGLSRNEAKVYLSMVSLGLATAAEIAKKSQIHRTNAYDAISKLIEYGLASHIQKKDKKYYEATDPENLKSIIKEKESALESVLPKLKLNQELAVQKGQACVFEGVTAFTRILDGFLKHNEPILVYGIPRVAPDMMKHFIMGFHKRRLAKGIKMLHIYNHKAMDRIKFLNKMKLTEARYLPKDYESQVSTNICGDEVVLVLWTSTPWTVQIKNKQIADAYKQFFNVLWNDSQVPK